MKVVGLHRKGGVGGVCGDQHEGFGFGAEVADARFGKMVVVDKDKGHGGLAGQGFSLAPTLAWTRPEQRDQRSVVCSTS